MEITVNQDIETPKPQYSNVRPRKFPHVIRERNFKAFEQFTVVINNSSKEYLRLYENNRKRASLKELKGNVLVAYGPTSKQATQNLKLLYEMWIEDIKLIKPRFVYRSIVEETTTSKSKSILAQLL